MQYTVTIPQLGALQKAFAQAPELVGREVIMAGNRSLIRYQVTARQKAPVDKGQLRGSIQVTPMTRTGSNIQGSVGTDVKHALWQEQGTGIYGPTHSPIRPRRGKVLVFDIGGRKVFARSVKGTKPRWFMKGSLEQNASATSKDFQSALDSVAQELGRIRP